MLCHKQADARVMLLRMNAKTKDLRRNSGRDRTGYNRGSYNMLTVLVIDDDPSLRDTIGLLLEKEGFRPVLAEDGKIGLRQALTLKPSLIVVDLRMPGMSGVEVCRQVRAAGMKTPLMVLSAIGDEIDKVLLLEIGADDYMVKPISSSSTLSISSPIALRTISGVFIPA